MPRSLVAWIKRRRYLRVPAGLDRAPSVTSISPATGYVSGGAAFVLLGDGFQFGATVSFDDEDATSVVVVSKGRITGVTPTGTIGDADVTVTNPDDQSNTLEDGFEYLINPAPTVASVYPATGDELGGTEVEITGTGFTTGATVDFDGTLATSVVVVDATTIRGVTPAGSGTSDVTVTNPDTQSDTLVGGFEYESGAVAPTVSSISPDRGNILGAKSVTITGTDFTGATGATVGGVALTSFMVVNDTTITGVTGVHASGAANVEVTGPGGSDTLVGAFTYVDIASFALTGWWEGAFTASPWVSLASAGASGSRQLTEGTNPPSASSGAADFDGTNDQLFSADALSTFVSAGGGTIGGVFWVDTLAAGAVNVYDNEGICSDPAQGYIGILVANDSGIPHAHAYIFDTGVKSVPGTITTGAWNSFQMRWNGTTLEARVGRGAWVPTGCNNVGNLSGLLCLGKNYAGAAFFDGKLREIFFMQSRISDTSANDFVDRWDAKYGLSL